MFVYKIATGPGDSNPCKCPETGGTTGTGTVEAKISATPTEIDPKTDVFITCQGTASGGASVNRVTIDCARGDNKRSTFSGDRGTEDCFYSCVSEDGTGNLPIYSPSCLVEDTSLNKLDSKSIQIKCKSLG
jgi:hypothetical protein